MSKSPELELNYGYKEEFNRLLGAVALSILGMLTMLPIAPTQVFSAAAIESAGMAPLVYLICLMAMIFTCWSYTCMSKEFPLAGSAYTFIQRGMNPHVGFVMGWLMVVEYVVVTGMLTKFSTVWLSEMIPGVPEWVTYVLIFVFAAFMTLINYRGINIARMTNYIFFGLQMSAILVFTICAVKFVFVDGGGLAGFSIKPFYQPGQITWSLVAKATSIAMLGFIGFDAISAHSEEAKDPKKTVSKAMMISLLVIGGLFMLQAYMATLVHPNHTDLDAKMGYFDIIREASGDFVYYYWIIVAVISVGIANNLVVQSAVSRIIFSMSRDGLLPDKKLLSKVHPKFKTPYMSIVFVGIMAVATALFLSLDTLQRQVNFGATTGYFVLGITVPWYYFFVKKVKLTIANIIGYGVAPIIGAAIIGFVWSGFDATTYYVGFSIMAVGILYGAYKSNWYKKVPPALEV